MEIYKKWFVIVNKDAGTGISNLFWESIRGLLLEEEFIFEYVFTRSKTKLCKALKKAINKGYYNFISIGGDGTAHVVINTILEIDNNYAFNIGVIPLGTGNDWSKFYNIPKNDIVKAIKILKNGKLVKQDIGLIHLKEENKKVYFFNIAGVGFDGFICKNIKEFRKFGFLAYSLTCLFNFIKYKSPKLEISFNNELIKNQTFLFHLGICSYSGGGMRLIKNANPKDGLFNITYIKKIKFTDLLFALKTLFSESVQKNKLLYFHIAKEINIKVKDKGKSMIQADGEVMKIQDFSITSVQKKIRFIVPKETFY